VIFVAEVMARLKDAIDETAFIDGFDLKKDFHGAMVFENPNCEADIFK